MALSHFRVSSYLFRSYCTRNDLPSTASTVVIGGGAVGTSLVYHLAKQGQKDVILLEKSELTAGSTWHAGGITTLFHPGVNLKKLHLYSINLYSQLTEETEQDVGFHQVGSIRLAYTPERVEEFRYQMSRAGWHDTPQTLLSANQVKEMVPIIKSDKLLMGLYNPCDGYLDPYGLTQAMAKGARKYGATIYQHTPVTSLKQKHDTSWIVETPTGNIQAQRIVNAAGTWAKDVARLAGCNLPIISANHQYVITNTIKEIEDLPFEMPVLRHLEASCSIRQEKNGLMIGVYEPTDRVVTQSEWSRNGVSKDFQKDLFPPDFDRIMPNLMRVMEDIPVLSTANIPTSINGPITYTPDGLPLIGPDIIPNLWNLNGFSFGIIHAGGAGKYLADWIINGEAAYDLSECDSMRFNAWASEDYVEKKVPEAYGMLNVVGYANQERFAGRNQRITKAFAKQIERGAHMNVHDGWEQPAWFAPPGCKAEYIPTFKRGNWHKALLKEWEMVKSSAGIIDLTPSAKYVVEGREAAHFLNFITTNETPSTGMTKTAYMMTPRGKILSQLLIVRTSDDSFLVISSSSSEVSNLRWMKMQAIDKKFDVAIKNVSNEYGCISVAGPKSASILSKLSSSFNEESSIMIAVKIDIEGVETICVNGSSIGEPGWEIYHPIEHILHLYESILKAGSGEGIGDFGTMTMNTLRLENGYKIWGTELSVDRNPIEAGVLNEIKLDKEDFIGKDSLIREMQHQTKQKLVMASVDEKSESDPRGFETVLLKGNPVGNTTSGCWSFKLGKPLMYCYIPAYLATPGLTMEVELATGRYKAEILKHPPSRSLTNLT